MTSRWDALKPSSSTSDRRKQHGRGGGRHSRCQEKRADDNIIPKNPGGRRRNRAEIGKDTTNSSVENSSNWRTPKSHPHQSQQPSRNNHHPHNDQITKPPDSNAATLIVSSSSTSGPNNNSTEWDKLTNKLWKLGDNNDNNKKEEDWKQQESRSILKQLSHIQAETAKASSFGRNNNHSVSPVQRGDALAAALNLLMLYVDVDISQQEEWIVEVLEWCSSLLRESSSLKDDNIQLTSTQAQTCVQGLIHAKVALNECSNMDQKFNIIIMEALGQCSANVIISFAALLPAEETAHQVVGGMLLPALDRVLKHPVENQLESSTTTTTTASHQALLYYLQALHALLQEKKHASALLAPLVNDVAADGQEQYLINPIRRQLFQILQLGLQQTMTTTSIKIPQPKVVVVESIYQCLTLALQMATAVDKSSTVSAQEPSNKQQHGKAVSSKKEKIADVDVAAVESLLKKTFSGDDSSSTYGHSSKESTSMRVLVVELLLAFLKKRPEASLSLGKTLLFAENPTHGSPSFFQSGGSHSQSRCPNCQDCILSLPYSPFLDHLHISSDVEESNAMVECLVLLIQSIPWTLWMGRNQSHRSASSSFSRRITGSILNLINVAKCKLLSRLAHPQNNRFHTRQGGSSADHLPGLVKATLLEIPYSDSMVQEEDQVLLEDSRALFETLARSDLLLNERQPQQFRDSMVEVFGECLGGRETPEGLVTKMIAPACSWLSLDSSRLFVDNLVHHIIMGATIDTTRRKGGDDRLSLAKTAARLYCFLLRASPGMVLDEKADWTNFQSIVEDLCAQENKQLQMIGLQLLESLLRGRNDNVDSSCASAQEGCVSFVLSLLPQMTESAHGPCRIICFGAYGNLSGADWMSIAPGKGSDLKFHVDLILAHCTQSPSTGRKEGAQSGAGEPVASVRAAACKAIGDICSNCFLDSTGEDDRCHWREESLNASSHVICLVLCQAIKDGNASVRSMAIFALGNLAQVLCEASPNCLLSPERVQSACLAVHNCVDDSNDKAVSNALRSLGHLGTLILRQDYVRALDAGTWNRTTFLCSAIHSLSSKVDAILTALPGRSKSTLSWKQRSATKKHGRVACNSLAFMFPHLTPESLGSKTLETCLTAVQSLVQCIGCLGTQLDSKVLVASMLALQALGSSSLSRVSGKSGAVGHAMVACILFLAPRWEESLRGSKDRVTMQVESLLEHLLDSASIHDAAVVVACDEIAESWMDPLYQWMVVKVCKARAFDNFALALQKPGLNVSISVEHRFSNRALSLLRNARQSPLEHLEATGDDDEL